jgi:hypothetical protein
MSKVIARGAAKDASAGQMLRGPAGHIRFPKLHSALPALIIHIRNEPRVG